MLPVTQQISPTPTLLWEALGLLPHLPLSGMRMCVCETCHPCVCAWKLFAFPVRLPCYHVSVKLCHHPYCPPFSLSTPAGLLEWRCTSQPAPTRSLLAPPRGRKIKLHPHRPEGPNVIQVVGLEYVVFPLLYSPMLFSLGDSVGTLEECIGGEDIVSLSDIIPQASTCYVSSRSVWM